MEMEPGRHIPRPGGEPMLRRSPRVAGMGTTRRGFVRMVGGAGAGALLGGCEGIAEELRVLLGAADAPVLRPPEAADIDDAAHLVNRLTWGPRPGERERVAAMGEAAFIDEQLDPQRTSDRAADRAVASISSLAEPTAELYDYDPAQLLLDLTRHAILRAVHSRRQLFEVMVDFWTDHLNIVSHKGDCRWLKAADDRDVIRVHALGRFRDLIRASALSPAMLIFLDGHANMVSRPGDRPNENHARELLELHTLGVHGGYTQRDVSEVARCLSGWTYENRPFKLRAARVSFVAQRHDQGAKEVLGHALPAGGGADDLERVLDIVAAHESTARHLAQRLCRRFIADPAPEPAVAAVAAAFRDSGGDIRRTLRALLATPEFRAHRGNLFKRPLHFVCSALRATEARTDAGPAIGAALERMGQAPFQYPGPDGHPLEAAPWLGSLLWRFNFALALQQGGLDGTRVDAVRIIERFGSIERLAAHLFGRVPGALEGELLRSSRRPLALALASPAFQWH
jgi:uncharacterized protein (DUF1800 family)